MSKVLILILMTVTALVVFSFSSVTQQTNAQMQTRYSLECGLPVDMPPELWQEYTAKQYNYDLDSMPEPIRDQYTCATMVKLEEGRDETIGRLADALRNERSND